jgi:hypothetical protein
VEEQTERVYDWVKRKMERFVQWVEW